ncbi:MAG: nuclear transport factor 2 family protein [Bacteroidota bacterium]|nr:nuclear transport factor 2 family protein [Bacteroidota bacterium]MDX5447486.1 nuclear transport factor 2 family protein [Bacteroidota bacterium]MDX5505666.1 nuclear transport factor 2 family protein [Bacteroidota bacterium]
MRYFTIPCLLSGLILSCTGPTKVEEATLSLREDSLKVLSLGRTAEWAINHNSMDTVIADYLQTQDAFFVINGYRMDGFDKINEAFQKDRKGLKIHLTDDKVIIHPNSAIHLASFDQIVITPEGDTIPSKGVWTSFYQKINGTWKLLGVHESLHKAESAQ